METSKGKNMGRQKIAIEKIVNKNRLKVTFSKRRGGLFKKENQISVLCGAQIAVIVKSPTGKIFLFGNPSVDSVIRQFENRGFGEDEFTAAGEKGELQNSNWWEDVYLENLGLEELKKCRVTMQVLKNNLLKKTNDYDHSGVVNSYDDVLISNLTLDQFGGLPVCHYDRSN
ncbi:hypothetical protein FXO38_33626 [Capsicum annuum]|nr:hypothetical protein FXO38_33626 [Capsicum annuum]KAF3670532.1 hypothetical protein FXO37_08507 [Capsicum annuum]